MILRFRLEMEADDNFPPDSSDDQSHRGSVASSATLSRGTVQQIEMQFIHSFIYNQDIGLTSAFSSLCSCMCFHSSRCTCIPVW